MTEAILSGIMGPYGALLILVVIMYGAYKMINDKGFPIIESYVKNVDENMKSILIEHKADREAFISAISSLTIRQERLESTIEDIKIDVNKILDRRDINEK